MGYGSYSASDWKKLKTSRNLESATHEHEVFKRTSCNPKMNPKYIGTRECFDSQEHPNTTPIVVGLDVTASMGYLAVSIAKESLNDLIEKLYSTGAVTDPALMCAAYGDFADESPLQVSQFESDIRIAEQLLEIYFENRGNGEVVPTCLWEFLAHHTNIDAINKRNQKGFLFTIGDNAEIRTDMVSETIKKVIGDNIPFCSAKSLLEEVQKKFHVFHIMVGSDGDNRLLNGHKITIGRTDIDCIPEIIIATVQMQNGIPLEEAVQQWSEIKRPTLYAALSQLSLSHTGNAINL